MRISDWSSDVCSSDLCYGKLRETWERVIEEVLLNDVVQRFRPSIEAKRLGRVNVDGQDYVTIDKAMSKCSALMTGHDEAGAIASTDRKSCVEGKRVSVRLNPGGRRIIKKKQKK